jgi:undecaprenyl-diphosphatase
MQEIFNGIFFALIQGIMEFFPVSSSAHLYIAQYFLKSNNFLEIKFFLECACFLVVLFYYRSILLGNLILIFHPNRTKAIGFFLKLLLSLLPLLLYIPLLKFITFRNISFFLIWGSILMVVAELFYKRRKNTVKAESFDDITNKQAFFIGVFQGLSLFSGFSRSGSSISGGLICGLSRPLSVRFSFLISIPAIFLALTTEYIHVRPKLTLSTFVIFAICFIIASIAIKPSLALVSRVSLLGFALYRILVSVVFFFFI